MKFFKLLFVSVALLGMTSSCTNNFLDLEPETSMPTEEIFDSYRTAEAALVGTYDMMSSYNFEGLYNLMNADLMSDDLMLDPKDNWGWFVTVYQLDVLPSYSWVEYPWTQGYKVISDANNIITNTYKIPDATEIQKKQMLGEAHAIRGYSYLTMVRQYADAYSKNPEGKGMILKLSPASYHEPDLPRSTVKETYAQIVKDLKLAEEYLFEVDSLEGNGTANAGRMTYPAAQATLARAYMDMEEWQLAEEYSSKLMENDDLTLTAGDINSYINSFVYESSETIFFIDFRSDDNGIFLSIPSFYFPLLGGYCSMRASDQFYNSFEDGDLRKQLFVDKGESFADSIIDTEEVSIIKFLHGTSFGQSSLTRLRLSEMYLINAEANAELGNTQDALKALNAIETRAGLFETEGVSNATLIDIIMDERRREFFGEGLRLNDIKRRNLPMVRESNHWVKKDIQPDSEEYFRLTFPIPQSEIDANTKLSGADQNAGY